MATVRYQVDDVPHNEWAHAFFPTPGLTPAGQFSLRRMIHGFPGTRPVPSPRPAGSATLSTSSAWKPPSSVAPDTLSPQLWWDDIAELHVAPSHAGSGIRYMPHVVAVEVPPVVPIGALGPLGPARVAMTGRKVGGRRAMKWPRSIIRWPNLAGKYD
jgi:hypothetical protein